MKTITLNSILVLMMILGGVRAADAAPKGSGATCTSQGKAWSELDKQQCSACGGKWTVSDTGCGGGVIAGSLTTLGGILSANPIVILAGVVSLGLAKSQCDGKCEAKA